MSGLAVYDPWVGPKDMGTMWTVAKRGDWLRCVLWTHPLGWELRKMKNDRLLRTEVCKQPGDVFALASRWQKEALDKGWTG